MNRCHPSLPAIKSWHVEAFFPHCPAVLTPLSLVFFVVSVAFHLLPCRVGGIFCQQLYLPKFCQTKTEMDTSKRWVEMGRSHHFTSKTGCFSYVCFPQWLQANDNWQNHPCDYIYSFSDFVWLNHKLWVFIANKCRLLICRKRYVLFQHKNWQWETFDTSETPTCHLPLVRVLVILDQNDLHKP